MKKRYWNIRVSSNGWVSSTHHYFVYVTMVDNNVRVRRTFLINAQSFLWADGNGYLKRPQYVVNEVLVQLKKQIEAGTFLFYEHDRNGRQRWENLRYYDPAVVAEMMASWPGVKDCDKT
ncbi:MAG: hypothetical protein KJ063_02485 [Anaerolineae bacterium]|nr:hypothetical protein [Anaerolineae bacterium]